MKIRKAGLIISIILIVLLISIVVNNDMSFSKTDTYEIEFYAALLNSMQESDNILLEDIVPAEWDVVKVFTAYATKENKIKYAGYKYGNQLMDLNYEDMMSLLFLKDGKVVYYVDALLPRRFQVKKLNEMKIRILKGFGKPQTVQLDDMSLLDGWAYTTQISESHKENKPYFEIAKNDSGIIRLILKNDND